MADTRKTADAARTASVGRDDARSVADLLGDIASDMRALLREEVALAKAEFNAAIKKVIAGAILLGIGAVLASTGVNALVASAVLGLATVWAPWLAALAVGLVIVVLGGLLALGGLQSLRSAEFVPDRTLRTLRENVDAIKGNERNAP